MSVVIETTLGDLTVDLFTDERPVACLNFIKLCKLKYYNYNLFHTVEQNFIAQTGDPTGVGDGGSSVWGLVEGVHKRFFEAESLPKIHHESVGLLSLVSAGKNLAGSQFFFTLGENLSSLDGNHCVIGEVVEGHDTLLKLNETIADENFRPYQDIRITHTVILDDPFPDPRGFQVPSRSPSPSAERLKNGRIAADEDIDDTDGKTMEEVQELLAEREAKARATILEIVGDLPSADMAPPENVLFICKLNPVTNDDDLEIIFSRFGRVKSCEVIRDKKSGDSLQYAFVEFEEQKSCEAAYFKMDNVLIDDRRIHVDFSQSVAKVKWRGKGRGVEGPEGRLDFNNLKEDYRRDKRQERHRDDRDARNERPRMTSEERRKAREERHREQETKARRSRSRSRSRNGGERRGRYDDRSFDARRPDNRRRQEYRNDRERRQSHEKDVRKRYSPSRNHSAVADRRRDERRSPERGSTRRHESPVRKQTHDAKVEQKRKASPEARKKDTKKAKGKKSKRASSTTSEDDSTSSSETESSSSETSDSSSEEERRRKKKHSKSKKKKSKSKKKSKKQRK